MAFNSCLSHQGVCFQSFQDIFQVHPTPAFAHPPRQAVEEVSPVLRAGAEVGMSSDDWSGKRVVVTTAPRYHPDQRGNHSEDDHHLVVLC